MWKLEITASFLLKQICGNLTKYDVGVSLVVQWLRIHLPMQGTQVQSPVQEDPTGHEATKPIHHNY